MNIVDGLAVAAIRIGVQTVGSEDGICQTPGMRWRRSDIGQFPRIRWLCGRRCTNIQFGSLKSDWATLRVAP